MMVLMGLFTVPTSPFQAPGPLYFLYQSPLQFLLSHLHRFLVIHRRGTRLDGESIRIVCISDTHTNKLELPPGDVLIHAGDLTNEGTVSEIQEQIDWLASSDFQHVVVIAGNHDSYFDPRSRRAVDKGRKLDFKQVHYLQHSAVELEFPGKDGRSMKLFGAPQIPRCGGEEHAFQYERGEDAWSGTLPDDIDVLITHTPPKRHLDLPRGMGCEHLLAEDWKLRPRLHVFGHVHAARGQEIVYWNEGQQAYERIMARSGWIHLLSPFVWFDVVQVLMHDILGIAWSRIFGGESDHTIMVNSGVVNFEGQRVHEAQWVDI